ncbi:MAG: ATP-binding protein [Spirochaetaceae bacterium]|nr:MAG: ATP-binding protein [Spirochaetaceae bacterium]
MDLVDNSIAARASRVHICIREDYIQDRLHIRIEDNGIGMDRETLQLVRNPFFTTKQKKTVGLGLSLFAQAARESGGSLTVESRPGSGTTIQADFGLHHPDRKPMGNLEKTLYTLQASHPEIEFSFDYEVVPMEGENETQT